MPKKKGGLGNISSRAFLVCIRIGNNVVAPSLLWNDRALKVDLGCVKYLARTFANFLCDDATTLPRYRFTSSYVVHTRRYWLTYAVASQREEWQACPKSVCRGGVCTVDKAVDKQVARAADALRVASEGA